MSVFSIILLSLLGAYIAIWAVDKWVITPRRERKTLPELTAKVDELAKKVDELSKGEEEDSSCGQY